MIIRDKQNKEEEKEKEKEKREREKRREVKKSYQILHIILWIWGVRSGPSDGRVGGIGRLSFISGLSL